MDDLSSRLAEYKQRGCEFARWRCVFKVGLNIPSHRAIISNADELARFAAICQSQKICPLIEPEVKYLPIKGKFMTVRTDIRFFKNVARGNTLGEDHTDRLIPYFHPNFSEKGLVSLYRMSNRK